MGGDLWIYGGNATPTDPALEIPDIGFENANIAAGGRSAVFNFPDGIHSWRY
jgi:diacylglycerol O-acyltransferase/trehalose O-mycolyltransferase